MLMIDKAGSPIWAMEHDEDGERYIGLRFDCGDAGMVKLTREQVDEVVDALKPWTRAGIESGAQTTTRGGDCIDKPIEPKINSFDTDPGASIPASGDRVYSCSEGYELRDANGNKYGAWATGDADIFGLLKCYPIHGSD